MKEIVYVRICPRITISLIGESLRANRTVVILRRGVHVV